MKRAVKTLATALFIYAFAGFLVLPAAIHFALYRLAPNYINAPLHIGAVTFNPFTLNIGLQSFKIGESPAHPLLGFDYLEIKTSWSSTSTRSMIIDHILLKKPTVDLHLLKDSRINIVELFQINQEQTNPPSNTEKNHQQKQIPFFVKKLKIIDGDISFTDLANTPASSPFSMKSAHINLLAQSLSWPEYAGVVELSTLLADGASILSSLQLSTHATSSYPQIQGTLDIDSLDISQIQPYITSVAYTEILSGYLSTSLHTAWDENAGLSARGDLELTHLQIQDERTDETIISWDNLQLQSADFVQQSNHSTIDKAVLLAPFTTIEIDEHLQVNLAGLAKPSPSPPPPPEVQRQIQQNPADSPPFRLTVNHFALQEGSVNFADRTFNPGFSAPISNLKGEITGFDTQSSVPTTVTLSGEIDRYSPVDITATTVPSTPLAETGVTVSFNDVELTTLTPYSSRFAGYKVQKGRMNLNLNYQIQQKQLEAQNHILLSHLTLGEKVPGEQVTSLPLKLAIALLKDRDGRIVVDLPIRGDLDNPDFELGPVIRMAITNFITNIITAPFNFLASLVSGNADEMSAIAFQPGDASVSPQGQKALASLTQALSERPELELEIEAHVNHSLDAPVLARHQLQKELEKRYLGQLKETGKKLPAAPVVIPDKNLSKILDTLLAEHELTGALSSKADNKEKQNLLITNWMVSEIDLRTLAIQRARNIKDTVITKGLDATRVYILDVQTNSQPTREKAPETTPTVTTQLKLTAE